MPHSINLFRLAAFGFVLAAAGCQSGEGSGFLGMGERKPAAPAVDDARITDEELRAYCPRITLTERTAVLSRYAKGGEGDPTKLQFRASISDATRACSYAPGTLTFNIAAAGRVIPGPASATGTISVPIVIRVVKGGEEIYRNVIQQQVTIASLSSPAQFVISDPAVSIPQPTGYDVGVFVGFDLPPEPERPESELGAL